MGVYYTCEYCGTTGKGQFYCNCHAKESKKMRRYTTILGSVVRECPGGWVLFEKLFDDSNGEIFYTSFSRGTFSLVEKADYKNAKREVRRQKDVGRCKCKPYVRCTGCAERALKIEPGAPIFDQEFIQRRNTDENFAVLTDKMRGLGLSEIEKNLSENIVMSTADIGYFLDLWLEDEEAESDIISEEDFEATCTWLNTIFVSCGLVYEAENWKSYKEIVRDTGRISFCEKKSKRLYLGMLGI